MLRHPSLNRVRGLAIISLLMLAGSAFPLAHPQAIHASDAAGVYSLVEDIAFETDPARPDEALRIRVYGVHALAYRPQTGEQPRLGIYTEPAEGYLYFACGPGDSATCRLEWQDLLKAVGSERCARSRAARCWRTSKAGAVLDAVISAVRRVFPWLSGCFQ